MSDTASQPSLEELAEELAFLGDDRDRCDYLIDLGFELPQLAEEQRTEQTRVHGCQSNVWLVGEMRTAGSEQPRLHFVANSEAMFVNGLIVVLRALYLDKTADEVLEIDLEEQMQRLDLDSLVTPQRKNGLFGMVQRLRAIAAGRDETGRGEAGGSTASADEPGDE